MAPRTRKKVTPHAEPFLRSLRIDSDYGSSTVADRYVLTSNALRATKRILGAIDDGVGGAWTLVGPFGTGKSAFCLYLARLLAATTGNAAQHAIGQFRQADPKLARRVFGAGRSRLGFEALLVSGSAEPISTAILRALAASSSLRRRTATAPIQAKATRLLRDSVKGARPSAGAIVALVTAAANSMKRRGSEHGLLLVVDELGQLLEYAAAHRDSADVFLLQELAELAVRSDGRLVLIGVLHQDFREYAAMLPTVERAEWEKIRGRFEDIAFEEPPSQLLRFVAAASVQCRQADGDRVSEAAQNDVASLAGKLWELDVAPPGLKKHEGIELAQSCAPLHPLTAILLGPIFRRVGQNERSAISFLASDEPTALRAWTSSPDHRTHDVFDVVHLYDHLVSSLGNSLLHTADAKRWAEAFEAESRHHSLSPEAVTVLRAVALLGIASRWYGVRASHDVLCYALANRLDQDQVDAAIAELLSASVVVHRKYNDSFVIWEGSDVEIEARLDEGRSRLRDTIGAAALLDKHHRMRRLLARRHSFETGTLRFFDLRFVDVTQLDKAASEELVADGRIVVVLSSRAQALRPAEADLRRFNGRTLILSVPPNDDIANAALEMAALEWVERNTPELDHDPTARRELQGRKADVDRQLRYQVDTLLANPGPQFSWFQGDRSLKIKDRRQLNEQLSKICDDIYNSAPNIDNEIINRQELSSSAAAARRNLLERMILRKGEDSLGLQGNPPERSIYRSLLSDEGLCLHRRHQGCWIFRFPPASHRRKQGTAHALFVEISRFLTESEDAPRPVTEIFDRLRKPPFGLRDGPIPVLVCAALLARESDVALYREGEFQPSLSPALFEDLIKRPADFSVRQLRVTGVRSEVFDKLGALLGQMDVSDKTAKQQVVTIARLLMRFIRSLPEYTQRSDSLTPQTCAAREVLLTAKEPETMLLAELPEAFEIRPFKTADRGRSTDIDAYVNRLRQAIVELRDCFPKLATGLWQALGTAFGFGTSTLSIRNALHGRASAIADFAVERDLRMLIDRIVADSASDEEWLDGVASFLAERLPAKWRDEDRAHFSIRLRQFVRRFTLLEATVADRPKRASRNGAESIRIALTSTRLGQLDHAVHLEASQEAAAQSIEQQLSAILDESHPTVAIAALCRLLHRRAAGSDSPLADHREGAYA